MDRTFIIGATDEDADWIMSKARRAEEIAIIRHAANKQRPSEGESTAGQQDGQEKAPDAQA